MFLIESHEKILEEFINWTKNKIRHHIKKDKKIYFREKEIWWTALGKNIGFEANGKHELFERPVLIIKKYNAYSCFILPLTTQIKNPLPWYQLIIDSDMKKKSAVNITQGRTISSQRLLRKEKVLDSISYNKVLSVFKEHFK